MLESYRFKVMPRTRERFVVLLLQAKKEPAWIFDGTPILKEDMRELTKKVRQQLNQDPADYPEESWGRVIDTKTRYMELSTPFQSKEKAEQFKEQFEKAFKEFIL